MKMNNMFHSNAYDVQTICNVRERTCALALHYVSERTRMYRLYVSSVC